jgi:nitrate reductase NapAB chaperone NapD
MVICSYVLIAAPGSADSLARRIAALPGCDVASAENRDVLLVVTEAEDAADEAALRESIQTMPGVRALSLAFGEVDSGEKEPSSTAGRPRHRTQLGPTPPAASR